MSERYDRIAAWATAAGIGLITLMIVWLATSRPATAALGSPAGPIVAMAAAVLAGVLAVGVASRRLSRTVAHR